MIGWSLYSSCELPFKMWPSLGGRAYGPYATAPIMTLIPFNLDLVDELDL